MTPRHVTKVDSAHPTKQFGDDRTCRADGCATRLSRYNPDSYCSVHAGLAIRRQPRAR
jgi:hypothetical protein